ncbi:hypothetical protein CYMTET_12388 [Cymbomonas tetramitiformis]|uniref:Uncharacterized protein n=1 Tax=Cymbomonas tetramitiformis TaxID=36881 RepID=A0AAE0GKR7_9CHLO|nr:hypothetical protein CYMTET_12388 [Cymbomonas tetramitiformis]
MLKLNNKQRVAIVGVLLQCLGLLPGVAAVKVKAALWRDDRPIVRVTEPYTFARSGTAVMLIKEVDLSKNGKNLLGHILREIRLGFVIAPANIVRQIEYNISTTIHKNKHHTNDQGHCLMSEPRVTPLFTLPIPYEIYFEDHVEPSYKHVWEAPYVAGMHDYAIFWVNCAKEVKVTFDLTVTMTNLDETGARTHLLPADAMLPWLYWSASALYLASMLAWRTFLSAPPGSAARVHDIMTAMLLFKALGSLTLGGRFYMIAVTGLPEEWEWINVFFRAARGVFLFGVILVAGGGWLILQPDLPRLEKVLVCMLVPTQMFAYLMKMLIDEEGAAGQGYLFWQHILHGIDVVCFFFILVPLTRYIWLLDRTQAFGHKLNYRGITGSDFLRFMQCEDPAVRLDDRLRQLRHVYMILIAFEFFPRLLMHYGKDFLPFHQRWLLLLAREVLNFAFYCVLGRAAMSFIEKARPAEQCSIESENVVRQVV